MNVYVGYESAYDYWDRANPRQRELVAVKRTFLRAASCSPRDIFEAQNLLGVSGPLHVMVPAKAQRRFRADVVAHACKLKSASAVFYQVSESVYVASPELCYFQLAKGRSLAACAHLGLEMCGSFFSRQNAKEPVEREPVTTPVRLRSMANRVYTDASRCDVVKALSWVMRGSRSPMESSLFLSLCLPRHYGGYALPFPTLNKEIPRTEALKTMSHKTRLEGDLVWGKENLIVEYNSNLNHTGGTRISEDARRMNALAHVGYRVIVATTGQVRNAGDICNLAEQISKALGLRFRRPTERQREKQRKLYAVIFPWWSYVDFW